MAIGRLPAGWMLLGITASLAGGDHQAMAGRFEDRAGR